MIQTRAVQSQAEAHRHDLVASAGSRRATRSAAPAKEAGTTQRSAAGFPVPGGRAVRRGASARIGAWLIEFGTRLGGATVRAS